MTIAKTYTFHLRTPLPYTQPTRYGIAIIVGNVLAQYQSITLPSASRSYALLCAWHDLVFLKGFLYTRIFIYALFYSPIDPHVTEYCLVMSSRKNYSSLCGAHGDRYGPYGHGLGTVKGNTSKMSKYVNFFK